MRRITIIAAVLAGAALPFIFGSGPTPQPPRPTRIEATEPLSVYNDGGSIGLTIDSTAIGSLNEVGNLEWISGLSEDGGGLDAAYREAVTSESFVYVLSNVLASEPWSHETHGNDYTADGTKGHPYLTFPAAVAGTGLKFIEGKRVVFMLGGGVSYGPNTPDGGIYDHLARAPLTDPWDEQCQQMRQYNVRSVQVGGSESHWQSWSVRGPRKMMPYGGAQPTITDFTYERDPFDGVTPVGRTKWRYNGDGTSAFANGAVKGYYLRITRDGGAGRPEVEVSQPIQITGSYADSPGSPNGYPNTDHGNYDHGSGTYDRDADKFQIVQRAAEFIPTAITGDTGGADGIMVTGFGASSTHDRLSSVTGHNEGRNPSATFERIGFENVNVDARGVSFETCYFYHSARFKGRLEFINSTIESQVPVLFAVDTRGISANGTEIQDNCGRAAWDSALFPDGGPDPVHPDVCGQSIYGYARSGGAKAYFGSDHDSSNFRVWKGFTWESGIEVRGPGSTFTMPDVSHTVHLPNATVALWARNGAQVLIDPHTIFFGFGANASTAHLKVGNGATIQLGGPGYPARSATVPSVNAADVGTFVHGAGWSGNFSRHLEQADGGYPRGDTSAIRDARVWWVP